MPDLFFAPASKRERLNQWRPYDNLQKTVLSPITNPARYGLPLRYAIAAVWGITDGTARQYGDKINPGSYVVFYTGDGRYPYVGKVNEYLPNRETVAKELWPSYVYATDGNSPGEPWRHLITFEAVWSIDIPVKEIRCWRNSPTDNVIRSFTRVPSERRRYIESQAVPVDKWIQKRRNDLISLSVETDVLREAHHFGQMSDSEVLSRILQTLDYDKSQLTDGLESLLLKRFKTFHGMSGSRSMS
jgi:hypothetical protein